MGCGSSTMGSGPIDDPKLPRKGERDDNEHKKIFEPFTDFPTPVLLFRAQADYSEAKVKVEEGEDGVPLPFPPPDTSTEDFSKIDAHASDLEALEYAEKDFKHLASYLSRPATSDLHKLRAFFVFIASQSPPKIFGYLGDRDPTEESPMWAILTIIVKKCPGLYNEVLQHLCKAVNMPCIIEQALVKGTSYRLGDPVQRHGNTVCVCYVDGSWRLVDQHWGSQSVSVQQDPHWQLVQAGGATQHKPTPTQLYYSVKPTWFLPDPVQCVYSHLCDTSSHQLLARPVTQEEFNQVALLRPGFFSLGLGELSHPRCVVSCADGNLSVSLGLDASRIRKYRFFYNLYKWVIDPDVDRFRGHKQQEFSRVHTNGTEVTFHMTFPWIGKYRLQVEGEDEGEPKGRVDVCEYLIQVECPNFRSQPHPALPRYAQELGVTSAARSLGLVPVSDGERGLVSAPNGHAVIKFKIPNVNDRDEFRLRAHMDGNHVIRQFRDDQGNLTVVTNVTKHGKHILRLDVQRDDEVESIRYIIDADAETTDIGKPDEYPSALGSDGRVGDLCPGGGEHLSPVSHPSPLVEAPQAGMMCIEMTSETGDLRVNSALFGLCKKHNTHVPNPDYLFTEQEGNVFRFFVRFPRPGIYSLNLVSAETGTPLYQYVITAHHPDMHAVPFPALGPGWTSGCKVLQPLRGVLEEEDHVQYEIELPSASEVYVKQSNGVRTELTLDPLGHWSGGIDVQKGVAEIGVYANIGKIGEHKDQWLLSYQVVNKEEQTDRDNEQERNLKETESYRNALTKRRETAKAAAESRKKKEDERIEEAEADFQQHREKYEARERELEAMKRKEEDSRINEVDYTDMNLTKEMGDTSLLDKIRESRQEIQEQADWRIKYNEATAKLALDHLKQAMVARDVNEIQIALVECEKNQLKDPLMDEARDLIYVERARLEFKQIMKSRVIEDIEEAIERIEGDNKLKKPLESDVCKARSMLEKLYRRRNNDLHILQMDTATITEIRRYRDPPDPVHRVIQAALLLLGEDEETTATWRDVQSILNTTGKNGLFRRVRQFDRDEVHPEIAARARDLVADIDGDLLKTQSGGAAVFYVWIQGVLADMIIEEEDHQAADSARQRELLGRVDPPPPSVLMNYYHKAYNTYLGQKRARPPNKGVMSPRAEGFPWGLDTVEVNVGGARPPTRGRTASARGVKLSMTSLLSRSTTGGSKTSSKGSRTG